MINKHCIQRKVKIDGSNPFSSQVLLRLTISQQGGRYEKWKEEFKS
jgi:hypothetical protein